MRRKTLLAGVPLALALPLALPGIASASSGGWTSYQATLNPITTNHVTGSGSAWVKLSGDTAKVTVKVSGLLNGSPHAMHFHVNGMGMCPTSAQAMNHNGHQAISTVDALKQYGKIGTSLTTSGDTSPKSALAVKRFPATGSYTYQRTITVTSDVAKNLRNGTAVVVVHGVDYNGNGKYDSVLGASQLDKTLPLEATAPALCGALKTSQMNAMPSGGANTGAGSTEQGGGLNSGLIGGGAAAIVIAAAGTTVLVRRRRTTGDRG